MADEVGFNRPSQTCAALLALWTLLAGIVEAGCHSDSVACAVMRPALPQTFKVISFWDRSIFTTTCVTRTPREIVADRADFSLRIRLQVAEDPAALIDAFSHGSVSAVVVGTSLSPVNPDAPSGRVTMFAQASRLPNRILEFQVVDKVSKSATEYRLPFDLISCTCRRGDGP